MDRKIDVHHYKGCTIDYVPRRRGYLVYLNHTHRVDFVFNSVEEAQEYIDKEISR